MKKYILIFAALFAALAFSCKEDKKIEVSAETSQMKEVMAIHDEVMPKMSKIGRLVATLRKKIDTDQGTAEDKQAMEDLQDANKSMMDWMQGFGKNFDSEEIMDGKTLTSEKQKLLDEEEKKINIVKEKMNTSIAKAEALLEVN
jgi:hypothetical protein